MLSLPLAPDAEDLEMELIERIAAVNGLRSNVRRFIKREMLHRSLNETRSSPHFSEFCNKNFSSVTGQPPSPLTQRETWLRLPYLGRPTELLEKELKKYGYLIGFYSITKVLDLCTLKDRTPPPFETRSQASTA